MTTYGSFLARSLITLVVPQGYTLSIAGSFAIAAHRYGFPGILDTLSFVAGAVVAFVTLAVLARSSLGGALVILPAGLRTLINLVPLAVVGLNAGLASAVPSPMAGYSLTGLVATAGYVVLVSVFFWLVKPGTN